MRLTFVCSGNTCRSPLALAAWQVALREMNPDKRARLERIRVTSAGLGARRNAPVTALAQLIAASWDADLSAHRARVWRPQRTGDADDAQTIVTMTREQAAQIRFRLDTQRARDKSEQREIAVETLGAFVPLAKRNRAPAWSEAGDEAQLDILDPYGGSREAYEECSERILRAVRALAESYGVR